MIGAAVFGLVAVVLTFAQYGFLRGLGWKPLGASDVPWPSALALGPVGWLQVFSFAFFGLTLILFALALHRGVASSEGLSVAGPALLVVAGVALVLAAFKTNPHLMQGPQTWHGAIHFVAFSCSSCHSIPALALLLVASPEEGPPVAWLRSIHPDHRDRVHTPSARLDMAVGFLPLPRKRAGLGRGDGEKTQERI